MSAAMRSHITLECEYCCIIGGSVQKRQILLDYHSNTYVERMSCYRCADQANNSAYHSAGIYCCNFCNNYSEDVELRSVFVDTMQNQEEVMCCASCEHDRLMSV